MFSQLDHETAAASIADYALEGRRHLRRQAEKAQDFWTGKIREFTFRGDAEASA